jgi:cytochrome c oxidase subunit 2
MGNVPVIELLNSLLTVPTISVDSSMGFLERALPPEDISTKGHLIDWLFNYTTIVNIFYFLLVCFGIFGFSFLYRKARNPKAAYIKGDSKKHLMATAGIGIFVFLSIDMVITKVSSTDLKETFWNFPDHANEKTLKVEVLGQQWMWNFRYAGKDGKFNTADDVLTNHELRIPVNTKVEFRITAKDVIHSLYFPNTKIKADAIPGKISRLWFEATKTGEFDIACAEMCGTHHYRMQGRMFVQSEDEFNKWLGEAQQIAEYGNDTDNLDNYWGWKWEEK